MIDGSRTIKLVTGAPLERKATWRSYLAAAGDWKKTAFLLTGPIVTVSAIGVYVMSLCFADSTTFGMVNR